MEGIARPCGGYISPYDGGSTRNRTGVLPVMSRTLYQLRYRTICPTRIALALLTQSHFYGQRFI